ncbi:hypothetical protein Nepgr_005944 [Nepenthes gracilis]|uniref:Uncharacterized protein n=1 Tax=Nepenthes gracilis TaxID=150966 RepID=A0AAD3S445_NEPGR|nr:hypothetical protein Nepgr_005944 [Nepenthes gracilis]
MSSMHQGEERRNPRSRSHFDACHLSKREASKQNVDCGVHSIQSPIFPTLSRESLVSHTHSLSQSFKLSSASDNAPDFEGLLTLI